MSLIRVVVEGPTDAALIFQLLPDEIADQCEFYLAGGKHSVASVARTHLTRYPEPVLIVADADNTNAEQINEERQLMQYFVAQAAAEERFRIIFAIPEIETLYFSDRHALGGWLGIEITEAEAVRAEFVPKTVLHQLLQRSKLAVRTSSEELVELLSDEMLEAMRQHPLVHEIETLLEELTEQFRSFSEAGVAS